MFLCCTILPHCCSLTDTHTGHEAWEQTELTPQWCREFTEFGVGSVNSSAPDCAAHILINVVDRDLSFFHCAAQGLGLGGKRQCRLLFAGHVKRFDYYLLNFVKLVVAEISVSLHLCNNTISKEEFYDYTTYDVLTFTGHTHTDAVTSKHIPWWWSIWGRPWGRQWAQQHRWPQRPGPGHPGTAQCTETVDLLLIRFLEIIFNDY